MKYKVYAASATLLLAAAALVACGNESQQDAPEPAPSDIINGQATQVIQMPDGFRNVATTCYKGNRIFVTSRGAIETKVDKNFSALPSSISVIAADPTCPKVK